MHAASENPNSLVFDGCILGLIGCLRSRNTELGPFGGCEVLEDDAAV